MESLHEQAYVTKKFVVSQGQEPGVVLAMSDYDRLIERLDGCKPGGWADLWLAAAGGGGAGQYATWVEATGPLPAA